MAGRKNSHLWFDEDGNTKVPDLQQVLVSVEASSIQEKLQSIGLQDERLITGYDGPMEGWSLARSLSQGKE